MMNGAAQITSQNTLLHKARKAKQDEFYTQLADIEKELVHYESDFAGKVVYCNCDDPRVSKFFHYFAYQFEPLGLKKLVTTCYKSAQAEMLSQNDSEEAIYIEYKRDKNGHLIPYPEYMQSITGTYKGGKDENNVLDLNDIGIGHLKGNGDFRNPECVELLKQADIVVTNPPFSLFREYVSQLIKHDKKFVIIGTLNAITYKEVFKLIKEHKLWLGINYGRGFSGFLVPDYYPLHGTEARIDKKGNRVVSTNNTCWFTNLDHNERHEELILTKTYKGNEDNYPKYDNYDAIAVEKTKDIPKDYSGAMGVPITFLTKYNPNQFEILAKTNNKEHAGIYLKGNDSTAMINGKKLYHRILIRHRQG